VAKSKPNQRAPVITVMGHIDHGKTTLLDAIRETNQAARESGGITQHIGAYKVTHQGRPLTFIDTPGHAAFAAMRSRGTKVTDLVILVVDAVEGVKPQTKESLDHIKAAGVPFLVAINKIDLPDAAPDKVKSQLAEAEVLVEGYGGKVVAVPVSAKTKKGLDQLLEMTLLSADFLDLPSKPEADLAAAIIESELDRRKGPLATVIVKAGTIKVGGDLVAGPTSGRARAIFDENGQNLAQILPGEPGQILGFRHVPPVGATVTSHAPEGQALEESSVRLRGGVAPAAHLEGETSNENEKSLKLILKADASGTLEAIKQNLEDSVTLVSSAVGDVSEADVLLAQSTGAQILAFRVKTSSSAAKLAEIEGITVTSHQLIHELLDDVSQKVLKLMEPTIDEDILGEAKIIAEFTVGGQKIAGCEVTAGKLTVGDKVHLVRGQDQLLDAKIKSLHQGKDTVDKVKKGEQGGVAFTTELDFKVKDKLIAFKKPITSL